MGTPRKINAILLNIKINRPKLVNVCRYEQTTCWQNFTEICLTWVIISQKVLGGLLFFDSHCRHDTLNVVKKTLCVEKGRTVDRMIKFAARQWKQRIRCLISYEDLSLPAALKKTPSISVRRRLLREKIDSDISFVNDLICSQEGRQPGHSFSAWISVNSVTFACCRRFFYHDSLDNKLSYRRETALQPV